MAGLTESKGNLSVNQTIDLALPKIFNFDYPLYDESHREELQRKILRHYYTREIGVETVGLWQMFLETRLNEIMPYYNEMYKTADITYNPLHNTIINREHAGTANKVSHADTNGSSTGNTTNKSDTVTNSKDDSEGISKYSDTPQSAVNDIDIEENAYLTNATINKDHNVGNVVTNLDGSVNSIVSNSNTTDGTINTTDSFTESITGKQGEASFAKMIQEYRNAIVNIDMDIIKRLSDLFMNVY